MVTQTHAFPKSIMRHIIKHIFVIESSSDRPTGLMYLLIQATGQYQGCHRHRQCALVSRSPHPGG